MTTQGRGRSLLFSIPEQNTHELIHVPTFPFVSRLLSSGTRCDVCNLTAKANKRHLYIQAFRWKHPLIMNSKSMLYQYNLSFRALSSSPGNRISLFPHVRLDPDPHSAGSRWDVWWKRREETHRGNTRLTSPAHEERNEHWCKRHRISRSPFCVWDSDFCEWKCMRTCVRDSCRRKKENRDGKRNPWKSGKRRNERRWGRRKNAGDASLRLQ